MTRRYASLCLCLLCVPLLTAASLPFGLDREKLVERAPWEWGYALPQKAPGGAAQARQVYAPVFVTRIAQNELAISNVLEAVTQGSVWNRRELAAPAYDPATGLVLLGTSDRHFYGVTANTGEVVWSAPLEGRISSTPIVDGELVYFGADDGGIYGVRKGTGVRVFRYQADSEVTAPLSIFGDRIYAHTALDTVVALRRGTGEWLWQTRHALPVGISLLGESTPTAGAVLREGDTSLEVVFAGHADGVVSALDASDGHPLWETTVGKGEDFVDVDADIQYVGGVVYAVGFHGGLQALDPLSGSTLWSAPVDGVNRMTATANTLVMAGPRQVMVVERGNGKVRWRFNFPTGAASRPVVHRGRVLVNNDRGAMYVLNFTDGRPLQYYGGRPGFTGQPAVWRDSLFLLSNGGSLHALSDRFSGVIAAQRDPW